MYQLNIKISDNPKEDLIFHFKDFEFSEILVLMRMLEKYSTEIFGYEIFYFNEEE